MITKTLLAGTLLVLSQCGSDNPAEDVPATDALTIRSGSSFGMCVGYCQKDYVFNGTTVTLTQRGTRTQNPTQTCERSLPAADWNALKASANFDAFSRQPDRLGCPDCADGGAEYVELSLGDRRHRVTFEYGKTIPGFESLITALRRQRDAFSECP